MTLAHLLPLNVMFHDKQKFKLFLSVTQFAKNKFTNLEDNVKITRFRNSGLVTRSVVLIVKESWRTRLPLVGEAWSFNVVTLLVHITKYSSHVINAWMLISGYYFALLLNVEFNHAFKKPDIARHPLETCNYCLQPFVCILIYYAVVRLLCKWEWSWIRSATLWYLISGVYEYAATIVIKNM